MYRLQANMRLVKIRFSSQFHDMQYVTSNNVSSLVKDTPGRMIQNQCRIENRDAVLCCTEVILCRHDKGFKTLYLY